MKRPPLTVAGRLAAIVFVVHAAFATFAILDDRFNWSRRNWYRLLEQIDFFARDLLGWQGWIVAMRPIARLGVTVVSYTMQFLVFFLFGGLFYSVVGFLSAALVLYVKNRHRSVDVSAKGL